MNRQPRQPSRQLSDDDALHASYSKNMTRESTRKALLKFAKDKGLADVEIWPHGDQWAMRFTNRQGEPRQTLIGNVFAKARGVILSMSGGSLASQIEQLSKKYPGVQFSAAPNGGIKVRGDNVMFVGKDINDVIAKLKGKGTSLAMSKIPKTPGTPFTANVKGIKGPVRLVEVIGSARLNRRKDRFILTYGGEIRLLQGSFSLQKGDRVFHEVSSKARDKSLAYDRNSTEDSAGRPIKEGDRVKISKSYGGGTARVKQVMSLAAPKKAAKKATQPYTALRGVSAEWFIAQGIKNQKLAEKAAEISRQGVNPMDILRQAKDRQAGGYDWM